MEGKHLKRGKGLAVLLCCLLLTGCSSWRRSPSGDLPKEVPTSAPVQQEADGQTGEDTQTGENSVQTVISQQSQTGEEEKTQEEAQEADAQSIIEFVSASVTSSADESLSWETGDEMLSRQLYDLLMHKQELFTEKFDERVYDYLAVITDSEGTEYTLCLWINYARQNEIIVEDEQGGQWNISVEDSNQVRIILDCLG